MYIEIFKLRVKNYAQTELLLCYLMYILMIFLIQYQANLCTEKTYQLHYIKLLINSKIVLLIINSKSPNDKYINIYN